MRTQPRIRASFVRAAPSHSQLVLFSLLCSAQPQPRLPVASPARAYDIGYYTRDVRRNPDPAINLPIDSNFSGEARKYLISAPLVEKPEAGSPGQKNPDVIRYDPSGVRTAMTTNWASLQASLQAARPNHIPTPAWMRQGNPQGQEAFGKLVASGVQPHGVPKLLRLSKWGYTQVNDW